MNYEDFIKQKSIINKPSGFEVNDLPEMLFDYQKDLVSWSLRNGKSAMFTDTGTGKTIMQIIYGQKVYEKTNKNVLLLAPIGVSYQTVKEAKDKLDIEINNLRKNYFKKGLNIINYERLHTINVNDYDCIIADESSILKSYSGSTRNMIIDLFRFYNYKLCCTATPSPNDYEELGNHSEHLNILKRKEMLSMFFTHDSGDTSKWRLKKHAENKFWQWLSSWAVIMRNPLELGYTKDLSIPELITQLHIIESDVKFKDELFVSEAESLEERREARKLTLKDKIKLLSENINNDNNIHLVWCDLNIESEMAKANIKSSYEIKGSDKEDYKEKTMLAFANGEIKCLITKPSIAGHGMNWQACHNVNYIGLSDSFEDYYQSVRRCYRYGQKQKVKVNIYLSNLEKSIYRNIQDKEKKHEILMKVLIEHTLNNIKENLKKTTIQKISYNADKNIILPKWVRG